MRQIHLTTDDDYKKNLRQNIDKLVLDGKWVPMEEKTLYFTDTEDTEDFVPNKAHYLFAYGKL